MSTPTTRRPVEAARPDARRAQLVAGCASLLVVLATSGVVQGLYSDPAVQLKAVQQRLTGESTSMNLWVHPDRGDVSRDTGEWLVWWTPGTELLAFPLMRAGLSLGGAVRAIAATALIAGSIGWATWFSLFELPGAIVLLMAAAWPCVRIASNGLFLYSAEMLVFAAAPWLLLATRAFLDRPASSLFGDARVACGLGLLLGGAYWLKGSLAFIAVGAIVAVAFIEWRRLPRQMGRVAGLSAATAAGAAIPFLALAVINRLAGGGSANLVTAAFGWHVPGWRTALDVVAVPALQVADAGALWEYLLRHPARPIVQDAAWISLLGLPGGLLLLWFVCRPRIGGSAPVVARSVFFVSVALLLGIWTISPVSHEPRHIASAAFAVCPLLVAEARRRWTGATSAARLALAASGVFYLCLPLGYGVTSVVQKVRRFPPDYRPGPARIYNALLSATDIASVRETLLARTNARDLWYLTEAMSALDLPGRAIITHADFQPIGELQRDRFVTSQPLRVRALLPARFELNDKGPVIRRSFPQAGPWAPSTITGSDYVLWTADLAPDMMLTRGH
jgi:hypothetical protein